MTKRRIPPPSNPTTSVGWHALVLRERANAVELRKRAEFVRTDGMPSETREIVARGLEQSAIQADLRANQAEEAEQETLALENYRAALRAPPPNNKG